MFRIKICGITTVDDALVVVAAGADSIGLNFYPKSPRHVRPEVARNICQAIPAEVKRVGVFVNATVDEVRRTLDALPLDLIQLHGDESPEYVAQLAPLPILRAFRLRTDGSAPVVRYLNRCEELGCPLAMVLLDAFQSGQYGGTGETADWSVAKKFVAAWPAVHVVLAGGLTSANVAEAICTVRPWAVDTASGVESSPGRKERCRVQAFVDAARGALVEPRPSESNGPNGGRG